MLVAAYLGAWATFSLYSVRPFRLKSRGALGLIADACGAHVFPGLTAALLAYRAAGKSIDPVWIAAVVLWALGYGLRGILWHQLYDFEADRKAAVQTFVVKHSRRAAERLVRAALIVEAIGLAMLLWQCKSVWPVVFLLVYATFATLQSRVWNVAIVLAEPGEQHSILGSEYYKLLFPLGFLLSSALQYSVDWVVIIAHLAIFRQPAVSFINEARLLLRDFAQHEVGAQWSPGSGYSLSRHNTTQRHDAPQVHTNCADSSLGNMRVMTPSTKANSASLDAAIPKTAAFLRKSLHSGSYGLASIDGNGAPTFADNKGHVFVASFITEAMTGLFDEIDRTIIITRILSEENAGLWGYAPPALRHSDETNVFHVDSDDSAFVIRTLQRLGVNRQPDCLMRFYREPEQLFATWDAPGSVQVTMENSPANNFMAHPEVNANVFLALRGTHFEEFVNYEMILTSQDEAGFWKSYFYPSPLYGTLLALDLTRGNPAFASANARALAYIVGSQNADGSWGGNGDPYETALAVAALAGHQAHASATRRGVDRLLSTMAADGSWTSSACVWEFHLNEQNVWRGYDKHGAFVSALCLTALRRAAGQLAPP